MGNLSRTKRLKKGPNKGQFKKGNDPRRHRFTAEERRRAGQKGKKNLVPFEPGYDPRRHVFTAEECSEGGRRGFDTIFNDKPHLLLWLKKKLRKQGRYARDGKGVPCAAS